METDVTPHTLSVVELRFDFAREGFSARLARRAAQASFWVWDFLRFTWGLIS